MSDSDHIFIEGLRVEAQVGIYPRERVLKQPLEIDLRLGMAAHAGRRDDIADTIDYDKTVQRIRQVLAERQFNLLEALAEFLAGMLIEEFGARWVRLAIAKPGVIRGVRRIGVNIERYAVERHAVERHADSVTQARP
ncbi:dihydroneopterin aldolase [Uliginosibacterium sp. H1]|uniref:dihydroneopterin aldolase n=1 Tax=Uliginosibacterium sp. H1 TaxID=3114757 RepID=UPI002E19FD66|nr:dihydroneopterin aldolase [Uliginosibacterium sp. H1]